MDRFRNGCRYGRHRHEAGWRHRGSTRRIFCFWPLLKTAVIPGRCVASSPESILTMVVMDSEFALRAPRNDGALLPRRPLIERTEHGERHRGDAGFDRGLRHRRELGRVVGG